MVIPHLFYTVFLFKFAMEIAYGLSKLNEKILHQNGMTPVFWIKIYERSTFTLNNIEILLDLVSVCSNLVPHRCNQSFYIHFSWKNQRANICPS